MNEWMEFSAKTVEEAINQALENFKLSREELEIEVVERESKGLLGMFSKSALVKARVKDSVKEEDARKEIDKSDENEDVKETEDIEKNEDLEDSQETEADEVNHDKKIVTKEDIDKYTDIVDRFLKNVFEAMEIEAETVLKYDEENNIIEINIAGPDMGILIGKRGQTLDSLQYLASLVVNKESKTYIKIKLDTENYRERRKETLENLAVNIAHRVKRTRKPVTLEPMNPYDRRIIHSALQNDKFVETHSEGEEPNRKVVVTLKKGVRTDNRKNGYRGNRYSGKYDSAKDYKKKFNENYKKSYQSITFDDVKQDKSDNNN